MRRMAQSVNKGQSNGGNLSALNTLVNLSNQKQNYYAGELKQEIT